MLPKVNSTQWLSLESLEGELWKDIPWSEGRYSVSNYGRVKSYKNKKILKQSLSRQGYYSCKLFINREGLSKHVHRLVAEAFIPNEDNLPCVNHKDEDGRNNRLDNLEWCTMKYNSNYGTCQERRVKKLKKILKDKSKVVCKYSLSGILLSKYKGKDEIIQSGASYSTVLRCCKGKIITACGFVWRYEGDKFSYRPPKRNDDCCKKPVVCMSLNGEIIKTYNGITDASIALFGNKSKNAIISRCCNGGRPTAYGFKWRYA